VKPPAVSVLLPVHDGERFLAEALDSVLGQTLAELDVVVVNDGSTDGTAAALARYDDSRVRVVHRPHGGLVAALEWALREAGAPLLARMDADDVSLPERLERQVGVLQANPDVGLVACGVEVIDERGAVERTITLPSADEDLRRRLLLRNPFAHGSVVLRREALEKAGGYRPDYGANEDYDLWRRIARAWKLAAVPEILYRYREHGGSVTAADTERLGRREALRDELWGEPALLRAVWGERDPVEARALAREAIRRGRPLIAARVGAGYLARRVSTSS
jgi:glycosyltransferase involved in cell wall biosynthesis